MGDIARTIGVPIELRGNPMQRDQLSPTNVRPAPSQRKSMASRFSLMSSGAKKAQPTPRQLDSSDEEEDVEDDFAEVSRQRGSLINEAGTRPQPATRLSTRPTPAVRLNYPSSFPSGGSGESDNSDSDDGGDGGGSEGLPMSPIKSSNGDGRALSPQQGRVAARLAARRASAEAGSILALGSELGGARGANPRSPPSTTGASSSKRGSPASSSGGGGGGMSLLARMRAARAAVSSPTSQGDDDDDMLADDFADASRNRQKGVRGASPRPQDRRKKKVMTAYKVLAPGEEADLSYAELRMEDEKRAAKERARQQREERLAISRQNQNNAAAEKRRAAAAAAEYQKQQQLHAQALKEQAMAEWEMKKRASESLQEARRKHRVASKRNEQAVVRNEAHQNELKAHMVAQKNRFDKFQRDEVNRVKIEGLKAEKLRKDKEWKQEDILSNSTLQNEHVSHSNAEKAAFEKKWRHEARVAEMEGLKQLKERRHTEYLQKDVLANERHQNDHRTHSNAVAAAFEKDWRHQARVAEMEGLKQLKERRHQEYLQKDVNDNEKYQAALRAHMVAEKKRFDDFQRDDVNRVKIEGLKAEKLRKDKEWKQEDILSNSALQNEHVSHSNAEKAAFEKKWRHEARVAEMEGLKQLKERRHTEYLQKDVLANEKVQGQVIAQQRQAREKFDKDMKTEYDRVRLEGYKVYVRQAKHDAKTAEHAEMQRNQVASAQLNAARRDQQQRDARMKSEKQSALAEAAKQRRRALQRQEREHQAAMRASAKPMGRSAPSRTSNGGGGVGGKGSPRSPRSPFSPTSSDGGGAGLFSDQALDALDQLEALLKKEDLLDYLEEIVEQGVLKPEDLANFEEEDIKGMATKLVHRRKLLALRKHYLAAQQGKKKKGLFGGTWGRKGFIL